MRSLIIAEKPSVALRIALSLGDSGPMRKSLNGVSYYELSSKGGTLVVVAAVGHLFSLTQKGAGGNCLSSTSSGCRRSASARDPISPRSTSTP